MKGDLFSIRTDKGYGLFQEFEGNPVKPDFPFYIVYYKQIESLAQLEDALKGGYYLAIVSFNRCGGAWVHNLYKQTLLDNKNKEISLDEIALQDNVYLKCDNNFILSYLGNFDIPTDAVLPQYLRHFNPPEYKVEYNWQLYDMVKRDFIKDKDGDKIEYCVLTKEMKDYPNYDHLIFDELLKNYRSGYNHRKADNCAKRIADVYYEDWPESRQEVILDYNVVKNQFPTKKLRASSKPRNQVYIAFCDRVESALKAFISAIDQNNDAVEEALIVLVKELNAIDSVTQLFGSRETQDIYKYIFNVIKSLGKESLSETLNELREW